MSESRSSAVRVARGASYLYIQSFLSNLFGVVYFAFATRFLSVYEIGVTSVLFLITTVFPPLFNLAMPAAIVKFVPEYMGSRLKGRVSSVVKKGLIFGFSVSVITSAVLFLSSRFVSNLLFGSVAYQNMVEFLSIDIFAIMMIPFLSSVLNGFQRFGEVSFGSTFGYIVKYAVAVILLHYDFGLTGVILGWIAGDFTTILIHLYNILPFKEGSDSVLFSELLRYSYPLYFAGLLNYFSLRIDQFLILVFLSTVDQGVYNAAVTASWVVLSVSESIHYALFPQFAERFGRKDRKALATASYVASRYLSIIYLPLAVGLATVALPTLSLVAGSAYIAGYIPLLLFSLTYAFTLLGPIATSLVSSLGKTKIIFWSTFIIFVADAALGVLMIPLLGIIGAALGKSVALILGFVFEMRGLKSVFGWHFDTSTIRKTSVAVMVMAAVVLGVQICWFNIFYLPLYVLVGGVVYFVCLLVFKVVNHADVELIKDFLPKRLGSTVDFFARFLID